MSIKVIVLNGQGGCGKDTFKNYIMQYNKEAYGDAYPIFATSMIDRVKFIAKQAGWTGSKDTSDRNFLYQLKQLLTKYNDLPYQSVKSFIQRCNVNDNKTNYVFVDAREAKDIDRLKQDFDCTVILITRYVDRPYGNAADDDVYNYIYDLVIGNHSTLERLQESAETVWDMIISSS